MARRSTRAVAALAAVAIAATPAGCEDGSKKGRSAPGARPSAHSSSHAGARRRVVRGAHRRPVPILMYHVVSARRRGAPFPELYTPARVFRAQMRGLKRRGYHAVTLGRVYAYWRHGVRLPRKPIVISFDDGYLGDYTHARPVLRRLGWPGVLNLELDNVRRGDLTAAQVRGLIAAGWEVDSHTLTHPDLTKLPRARLRRELRGSRAELRRRFHVPAAFFCYPSGRLDARVVGAVRRAGYRLATTTQPGFARPGTPFALNRIRVGGADGVRGLLAKLAHPGRARGGYTGG
jgi:peptidoglycan/xylan/chitin deacetylase (PgdA/CDA1 family)